MDQLPQDRMAEAEVALRLAFYLLDLPHSEPTAEIAVDGAQIKVGRSDIFPIQDFLADKGWTCIEQRGSQVWQGLYQKGQQYLNIHSRSGIGDVVIKVGEKRVRTECKKGSLVRKRSNPEYRLLREAIGQIITTPEIEANDVMVVAVPKSENSERLVSDWRDRPLVKQAGIRLVMVGRDSSVDGLDL